MRHAHDLDRELEHLFDRLPRPFGSWLHRLNVAPRWQRVLAGAVLILGGIFSFLPILGIWMLPLGIVLLAKDVPFLRRPSARSLAWLRHKFPGRKGKSRSGTPELDRKDIAA